LRQLLPAIEHSKNHAYSINRKQVDLFLRDDFLVISLLKRWLAGTHQGAVASTHLQAYLDEFSFRFNRRKSQHRGLLFYRLMQQAILFRLKPIKDFMLPNRNIW
jgi:hypothetical protein